MNGWEEIEPHGLTDVPGFRAAGVACNIRGNAPDRKDLALVVSERPCAAAATFTRNAVQAAPVRLSRQTLELSGSVTGFVANSGNANAATGAQGDADAARMQELAASVCGLLPSDILVASTGRIGRLLPMDRVAVGLKAAGAAMASTPAAGLAAADAILTSDSRRKTVTVRLPEHGVTIAAMAKGAGMIQPDMATMLAFIATDALVDSATLQPLLRQAVARSFNAITVDGDMSTNDTVLVLANGRSGASVTGDSGFLRAFSAGLDHVCDRLARQIVGDGERISKVVEINVEGAASEAEADLIARSIGNSLLVKTSWFGSDPNWGRLLSAAGAAGVAFDPMQVELFYVAPSGERVAAYERGELRDAHLPRWREIVREREFGVLLRLHLGQERARVFSTDLTDGYVHYNKSE